MGGLDGFIGSFLNIFCFDKVDDFGKVLLDKFKDFKFIFLNLIWFKFNDFLGIGIGGFINFLLLDFILLLFWLLVRYFVLILLFLWVILIRLKKDIELFNIEGNFIV